MNEPQKIRHRIKFKRKHKTSHVLTFLKQKRASPSLSVKNKSKEKKWEQEFKKLEENIDLNSVKNNFQHFFHINLEEGKFEKDLVELEKVFTPTTFWRLINFSYFQDNCLKEKLDNLKKELNINNYNEDVLMLQDDSESNENKNGYRYNSLLTDTHDCKIKSDFYKQLKSLIEYIKKNNNIISIDLFNDNEDESNSFAKDKNLINYFIKKIHELNENNLKSLRLKIDKYISAKSLNKNNNNNNKNDTLPKRNNYIKYNPILELNHESLNKFNKLIDYIDNKESKESHNYELEKKIFSFSETFIESNNNTNCLTLSNNISSDRLSQSMLPSQNICCICNNGDIEQNQLLFRCEQCGLVVHQNCYGAQEQDLKNWVCDPCKEMPKEDVYNLECFLCPVKGGAFKKVELPIESTFYKRIMEYKHNKNTLPNYNYSIIIPKENYKESKFAWVHLSCALWNYNITVKNYEKKSGISLDNMKYEDFNSYCNLCKKDNSGPSIKCNNDSCECKFHPECARINNCCLEVEIINKEYQYNVYCYKHKPNLFAKRVNMNIKNEVQQIIEVNFALNNYYEQYKKLCNKDFYDRPKVINEIKICLRSPERRKSKNKKFKRIKKHNSRIKKLESKSHDNLIISIKKKRGRKRKNSNNISTQINNSQFSYYDKKKNLSTIQIENYNYENKKITNTIINNIGSGNNINIYVNNFSNVNNFDMNTNQNNNNIRIFNSNDSNNNITNINGPTIEINKNDFENLARNTNFNVNQFVQNPNEFIVYLIGFLNDYTLKNRICLKKSQKEKYSIYKKAPIYFLPYSNFSEKDFPWHLMGYNNLSETHLKKSFFSIIYDEKRYKELFLSKIDKTLRELKKNKKYERFQICCDNKDECIGAEKGVYYLLSFDIFKYKIFDETNFFPKKFVCPSCLKNINNIHTKNKNQKIKNVNY